MTEGQNDALVQLFVSIMSSAPPVLAFLYLIYRQERKETALLQSLIGIVERCFELRSPCPGEKSES